MAQEGQSWLDRLRQFGSQFELSKDIRERAAYASQVTPIRSGKRR
jgi:hypothetical protein